MKAGERYITAAGKALTVTGGTEDRVEYVYDGAPEEVVSRPIIGTVGWQRDAAPTKFKEGQRCVSSTQRPLTVLAVDDIACPGGGTVLVIAYRYDNTERVYLRVPGPSTAGWREVVE